VERDALAVKADTLEHCLRQQPPQQAQQQDPQKKQRQSPPSVSRGSPPHGRDEAEVLPKVS